jgi:hypothetical protein
MVPYFLLFIILHAGPGDTVRLGGVDEYRSLDACEKEGQRMMNWLTQPGVTVEGQCYRLWRTVNEGIG